MKKSQVERNAIPIREQLENDIEEITTLMSDCETDEYWLLQRQLNVKQNALDSLTKRYGV